MKRPQTILPGGSIREAILNFAYGRDDFDVDELIEGCSPIRLISRKSLQSHLREMFLLRILQRTEVGRQGRRNSRLPRYRLRDSKGAYGQT